MRLYELTSSYQQLIDLADELEPQTLIDTLQSLTEEIEDKAENIAHVVKTIEAEAEIVKKEMDRLKKKHDSMMNNAENLKLYLYGELKKARIEKVQRPLTKIWIQRNNPSVDITAEHLIPDNYKKVVDPVVDKKAILAALKMGEEIEGAEIKVTESIRIGK